MDHDVVMTIPRAYSRTQFEVLLLILLVLLFLTTCIGRSTIPIMAEPQPGIAFVSDRTGNWDIFLVQPDGSGLTQLTDDPKVDADPDWSPDGSQIAFRSRRDGSSDIFIMGADGSGAVNLIDDPADSLDDEFAPRWNPGGEIFSLYTDRFRPRGYCEGGLHQLALLHTSGGDSEIDLFDTIAGEQYTSTWSPDGRYLIFSSSCVAPEAQLYLYDTETGETSQLTSEHLYHTYPTWSHDGQYLALVLNLTGNSDIFILDLGTFERLQLTNHPAKDTMPSWSPDDSQIAFVSNRDGNQEIYIIDVDGSNMYNLTQNAGDDWYPSWSPVQNAP